MLLLKPNCECCDRDLGPGASDARTCSFECTFCDTCAHDVFHDVCPNCGGNFVPRPIRPASLLAKAPPATERHVRAQPCRDADHAMAGSDTARP
jgi:hypothetical protein